MSIGMCTATLLPDLTAASEADVRAAGAAAVTAGCRELSVWAHHIAMLDLDALGARVAVVEAAATWATAEPDAAAAEADQLVAIAAEHGASVIMAITMEPVVPDIEGARWNLARLAGAAAEIGAQVCVEFLPWSGIANLQAAWELVEPVGPSAGIVLDTWHWQRQPGGPVLDLLRTIPGERIGYVQLCDAAPEAGADTLTEAMSDRRLPGEGVVDYSALVAVLDQIGAQPFIATEVFNPGMVAKLGPDAAAGAMVAAGRSVLGTFGSG
jgi:sugar phosphate isomerase/epimerase